MLASRALLNCSLLSLALAAACRTLSDRASVGIVVKRRTSDARSSWIDAQYRADLKCSCFSDHVLHYHSRSSGFCHVDERHVDKRKWCNIVCMTEGYELSQLQSGKQIRDRLRLGFCDPTCLFLFFTFNKQVYHRLYRVSQQLLLGPAAKAPILVEVCEEPISLWILWGLAIRWKLPLVYGIQWSGSHRLLIG